MSQDVLEMDYRFVGKHRPPADGATAHGPWTKKVTGAGAATVQSNAGKMELALEATNEVQNLCFYWGDELGLLIDKLIAIDIWASLSASLPAAVTASFGLASARNDTPTSMSAYSLFQMAGANTVKALGSDGSNTLAATLTGQSLTTTVRRFQFDFGTGVLTQAPPALSLGGKANVLMAMEDSRGNMQRVLPASLLRLSAYSGGLQPFFQLQKTAGTAVGTLSIERVRIQYRQG